MDEKSPKIITDKNIKLGAIQPNSETNPHGVKIYIPRTCQGKGVTLKVKLDQDNFSSTAQELAFKTVDDIEFEKIAASTGSKISSFTASLSPPMI